ncbi:MAG: hypothetical protein NTU56_04560 [Proteobacteria bacterium]|nr:hypothetical protein [Pseudomonadota bacterium]
MERKVTCQASVTAPASGPATLEKIDESLHPLRRRANQGNALDIVTMAAAASIPESPISGAGFIVESEARTSALCNGHHLGIQCAGPRPFRICLGKSSDIMSLLQVVS